MAHPPSDDESFLRRWSRLKQETRTEPAGAAPPPDGGAVPSERALRPDDAPPKDEDKKPQVEQPFDPARLPSIDTLGKDSDYSDFLRPEVPEDLRRAALRKLWASDPVLSAPDALDMHNLDYNNVPTFPEGIQTLYRIGKGMLSDLEAEAEKAEQGESQQREAESAGHIRTQKDASDAASQQDENARFPGERLGNSSES